MNLGYHKVGQTEQLVSMDQWSGYMNSRRRLLAHIDAHCPGNVMTVSGDAHRHYAGDLIQDQGNGKIISSEYLATSISSGADGVGENDEYTRSSRAENPNLKALIDRRGYVLCDVGRDLWRGDLKVLDTIATRNGMLSTHVSFVTERGKPGLQST